MGIKAFFSAALLTFSFFNCIYADKLNPVNEKTFLLFNQFPLNAPYPKHFRTTNKIISSPSLNLIGLKKLHVLASGQFSAKQLQKIKNQIRAPITIVDLRQESHGFINGLPFSWRKGKYNWANLDKDSEEIERTENNLLHLLKKEKKVCIYLRVNAANQMCVSPQHVQSERELAKSLGLNYIRFYVPDHRPPTKRQAREFVHFVKTLPKNTWLYIHCNAGRGRTTTYMVFYDILRNGRIVPLKEILYRQHLLGGSLLAEMPAAQDPLFKYRLQRIRMIEWFYRHYHGAVSFLK